MHADCKGYITANDTLTINEENRLQKENQELKEQDEYSKFVIQKQMKEKDDEIAKLQQGMKTLTKSFKQHSESFLIILDIAKRLGQQGQEERKLDSETELETDSELKDQKFDKMLAATRETIKKKSELEKTVKEQLQNK